MCTANYTKPRNRLRIITIADSINIPSPARANRKTTAKPNLVQMKSEIIFLKEAKVIFVHVLLIRTVAAATPYNPPRPRSAWWFLLPVMLGAMGGIIAYFVVRSADPRRARDCLLLGLALCAAWFVLGLAGGVLLSVEDLTEPGIAYLG